MDDEVSAVSSGISQVQADARYVRKTKITLGEWMDMFDDVNFVDYNWSKHVRKSTLNSESNIETRVASFVTDMSISQLLKQTNYWYSVCRFFLNNIKTFDYNSVVRKVFLKT